MKYLKRYNESNFSSIVKEIEDMCIDLNDEYINTEVNYDDESARLEVNFNGFGNLFLWSCISEYIDRIINYLDVENWDLVNMFLGGDELINPEETIKNLNKIKYTLESVSFIFVEKEKSVALIKSKQEFLKQFTDASNIRGIKRIRYNESNFLNSIIPYGIKKMFKGESEDKITLGDIDELKDLFIEFCDEYNFTLRELDSDIFDRIAGRLVISRTVSNSNIDELVYVNNIFSDEKDGDYIMFSLVIGDRSNEELRGIFSLSNNIYDRILNMGYKCDINLYNISGSMDLFLAFRIGNQLNSVNNIKNKFRY